MQNKSKRTGAYWAEWGLSEADMQCCVDIELLLDQFETQLSANPQQVDSAPLQAASQLLAQLYEPMAANLVRVWRGYWRDNKTDTFFLRALADSVPAQPRLGVLLIRLMLRVFSRFESCENFSDTYLKALLPLISPALRSVAFMSAPGLKDNTQWQAGVDYVQHERRPAPFRSDGFVPLETLAGQRARLDFLGYYVDERVGKSNLADHAVVTLFQLDNDLAASGELDATSLTMLDTLVTGALSR
jgi:hypothetical protein